MEKTAAQPQMAGNQGSGAQRNRIIEELDQRFAEKVSADRAKKVAIESPATTGDPPSVLTILDDAIELMPATDAEFSILERYGILDFKVRMFRAREALVIVRELLDGAM